MRETASSEGAPLPTLAAKWQDLHDQAARLARLAELSPEPFAGAVAVFPAQMSEASEWQRELAWQGIDDIDAMMRPGLAALSALTQRGGATNAPALALWREFYDARCAVMTLAEQKSAED
ncbi:MAG: hypothetical protein AAFR64_05445 [Pseudomonadota bacterium]